MAIPMIVPIVRGLVRPLDPVDVPFVGDGRDVIAPARLEAAALPVMVWA
jgi:hypothetical protein